MFWEFIRDESLFVFPAYNGAGCLSLLILLKGKKEISLTKCWKTIVGNICYIIYILYIYIYIITVNKRDFIEENNLG